MQGLFKRVFITMTQTHQQTQIRFYKAIKICSTKDQASFQPKFSKKKSTGNELIRSNVLKTHYLLQNTKCVTLAIDNLS